jgi:hypothetical protein
MPNNYSETPAFKTLATSYYKMAQNYQNTSTLWSPISSIVFTSTQLPVANEAVSAPVKYGASNDTASGTSSNFSPIIGDVGLDIKNASDYCNLIYYEPKGEFRMASLMGGSNSSINNIDIQVYWKNRLDNKL